MKFGKTYYKKDRCKCKKCKRQFVVKRTYLGLSKEQKMLIERLLFERISLLGICRVLDIEEHQLYTYLDEVYEDVPNDLYAEIPINSCEISLKCLEVEADEAWSFVGKKTNKVWIWVAMHRESRQIIGLHIGDRSADSAQKLWESIPEKIRTKATIYTDDWEAYKKIIPINQHRPSKQKKDTNHMERFFCTVRQRASRLVRKTLSFSKKWERHIGAIRYFIALYNLTLHI